MNTTCDTCGQAFDNKKLAEYSTDVLGVPLTLFNAVVKYGCGCDKSDQDVKIVNPNGLKAAAALSRAACPTKLCGAEIKFLRKAIQKSAKSLSENLGVASETLSRWENDERPMNSTSEKLLRVLVVGMLADDAPLIDVNIKQVSEMTIEGFSQPGKPLHMSFELIRYKDGRKGPLEDEYTKKAA